MTVGVEDSLIVSMPREVMRPITKNNSKVKSQKSQYEVEFEEITSAHKAPDLSFLKPVTRKQNVLNAILGSFKKHETIHEEAHEEEEGVGEGGINQSP